MFAVIDIETTGGRPERDRITEIAILLHDGEKVVEKFSTLINPEVRIPSDITRLTGISNEMVETAPRFYEIAKKVVEMTEGAVFVAHNVRFDYSFVKLAFKELGFIYQRKTLCTVRLSRSAFPGLPSYSLGRLCESLDITIENRHRALGDAEATAILLSRIFEQNNSSDSNWLSKETKKTAIPPLLKESALEAIPEDLTGVYYFHNEQGHVIYVGKAVDIRKRMYQHFALSARDSKKSMQMKREIADISYEPTGNELLALLLESDEIKKLKPIYNVLQKRGRAIPYYGIFSKYDEYGYVNLYIERLKDGDIPLHTADNLHNARETMHRLIEKHNLCLAKCGFHQLGGPCFDFQLHKCKGACKGEEHCDDYNKRAMIAIQHSSFQNESFLVIDRGRTKDEKSVLCVERGQYKGFGFIDVSESQPSLLEMREAVRKYPHNRDIQQILCTYLRKGCKKISYKPEELAVGMVSY